MACQIGYVGSGDERFTSPLTNKLVISACALMLILAPVVIPQTRLKGRVHSPGNDPLVAREQVTIEGAGKYPTDNDGEFEFDLTGDLKVGRPARFHVKHVNLKIKVEQWIVVRPCDLVNGRTFSLPAVGSEPISIVVLPRGDPRLKSLNKDSILECTIEEGTSELKTGSRSGGPNQSSFFNGSSVLATRVQYRPKSPVSGSTGFPRVVQAAYRDYAQEKPSASSLRDVGNSTLLDQAFLASKAEELGFTPQELVDALNAWARSAEDRYQKGLAALYQRRYAEASEYISASIPSPPGEFLKRYVPLARAEYEQGHYPAAETALRKVLAVHSEDPLILNNLGVVLDAEGKYAEAEPMLKRALTIDEKALGPEHVVIAGRLNNLGMVYFHRGKYADAQLVHERALNISVKTLGWEHPQVALILNNLGGLYFLQRKYEVAETFYKRALDIDEKALGLGDPEVARNLNNLGQLYSEQGRYAEADAFYKRALEIDEKALGPEHPMVAIHLSNLGLLDFKQRKYAEADALYKRALEIEEHSLGPGHPDVAIELDNIGRLYSQLGRYAEADALYKRALEIDEKALPPEHPVIARRLNSLGMVYVREGKYAEAEPLYKRALAIGEKALGPYHPNVATVAENLAADLRKLGRDAEAKVYEDQAARIRSKKNE